MRAQRIGRPGLVCALSVAFLACANIVVADGPSITLQPVPPKTVPASDYPPGTTIVDQEIILGSVPARVWLEVRVTGWAPEELKGVQVRLNQYGYFHDGQSDFDSAGFEGENAICGDETAIGAGDLQGAFQQCSTTADCRAAISGRTGPCPLGEPASCQGGSCFWPAFVDRCDPAWIGNGTKIFPISDCECDSGNCRGGAWIHPSFPSDVLQDFSPSYLYTMVVDVPGDAKGTYTFGFVESETYLQNGNPSPNNNIPIATFIPAKITIPCGRCCSQDEFGNDHCTDNLVAVNCDDAEFQTFTANEHCNDCNRDGILEGCEPVVGLPPPDKCRFISLFPRFAPPPGTELAIRVRMKSLHHVSPPYAGAPSVAFTAFEGEERWAGPSAEYLESDNSPETFQAASLQCTPHYQVWNWTKPLHITGSAIVPSSNYVVDLVDISCQGNESNCPGPSCSHRVKTTRWGDVEIPYNPPSPIEQPNLGDIGALVTKFRGLIGAPIKARLLLIGDDVFGNFNEGSLAGEVGFGDIAACVDAFRGNRYPHTIAECP